MKKENILKDNDYLTYLENIISENRKNRFLEILEQRTKHFTVVIEDVYQMHNTSAVMRSCDAFGLQDVHVIEQRFARNIDKEIAMGAQKWVDIHKHQSTNDCIKSLKSKGYQIVATTPHLKAQPLDVFDFSQPSALFFGTEKYGLSDEMMQQADAFIQIPMVGFTESLNISVAAAIILQALTTRLKKSNIDWSLTAQEQFEKRIDWSRKSIKDIDFITRRYLENCSSK